MRELLIQVTEGAVTAIDALALLLILWGTAQAFVGAIRLTVSGPDGHRRREVWLRYARWLVAALTFQLAADIIETSIRSDWEAIAQLGAIAVIRTFLNYFLERDLEEAQERQRVAGPKDAVES
jgi:uncharacterized membrane protein